MWRGRLAPYPARRRASRSAAVVVLNLPEQQIGQRASKLRAAGWRLFALFVGLEARSFRYETGAIHRQPWRLLVGWSEFHTAWSFPMRNAAGEVVGIRLRLPNGNKLSVRGGHEGLFVPKHLRCGERLVIAEGPTDTAALLDLGLSTVGRPSCTGGVRLLVEFVQRMKPPDMVIVADADQPGQRGAASLAGTLLRYCRVRIITPPEPFKDARAWLQGGAMTADVERAIDEAPVRRLRITVARIEGGK